MEPEGWELVDSELEGWELVDLEVCLQLLLLKQPNMVWQPDLALDCPPFTQGLVLGAWELVVGPAWGNPVAGRGSELPGGPLTLDLIYVGATAWWRM